MTTLENSPQATEWYTQRVDLENGEIRYEAHGPKESFVRFEGPNAKADCDRFMRAWSETELESRNKELERKLEVARMAVQYGINIMLNELTARGLPHEWTPQSGLGKMHDYLSLISTPSETAASDSGEVRP